MRVNIQTGFTLVEMAVVLVILGLLLGGLLGPLAAQREIQQFRAADAALQEIREALLGYAAIYGALPCPDMTGNPGEEGYGEASGNCDSLTKEGFLPFKTLGLTEHDPWGYRWRYRVDKNFARAATPISLATGFSSDSLQVFNHENAPLTTTLERPVALFYSVGKNGKADGKNAVFNATGGQYQSGTPGPDFDDRLWWLSRPLLISRLISAGRL